MEEFLTTKAIYVKVCDMGTRFKVYDGRETHIMTAKYLQDPTCGCCDTGSPERFTIRDNRDVLMWVVAAEAPDDCCGCEASVSGKVKTAAGAVLGEVQGAGDAFAVVNASGDLLFKLSSGFFTSGYEIKVPGKSEAVGQLTKEWTFTNLKSRLDFPADISQRPQQHKVLLLATALEVTARYYDRERRK